MMDGNVRLSGVIWSMGLVALMLCTGVLSHFVRWGKSSKKIGQSEENGECVSLILITVKGHSRASVCIPVHM